MLTKDQVLEIRKDFEYLGLKDKPLVYFDNGATSQKPSMVVRALEEYYKYENGNPHRGAHYLAVKSTDLYENGRGKVAKFINANFNEVVFLKNTTEALNLIAYSWAINNLNEDDEILISIMEHHSNLVPWQYVAEKTGAKLVYLYLDENKEISQDEFNQKVSSKTKLFSITAASNVVGTMPDVKEMVSQVKDISPNVVTIVDGAQFIPHNKLDVRDIGCDFFVFSGHKMLAAMGIGVLYARENLLNSMKPFLYGGDMIEYVYEDRASYLEGPQRFEAGTQNVGGVKSLVAAIDYIEEIGLANIGQYESSLMDYAYDKMKEISYIDIYTTKNKKRSPVLTFNFKEAHPHDVASILDSYGIAIRSGHHCAQPLHRNLGINFSCRASFAFYNTFEEVDYFIDHLEEVRRVMGIGS